MSSVTMPSALTDSWSMIKQTFAGWTEDKVPQLGAALAFYTALSIAPLLVISLAIAGMIFGEDAARGGVQQQLSSLIGEEGGKAIQQMIANANKPAEGTLAAVLSLIVLISGASGVFGQLQQSLNTIWEVQPKPGRGLMGMLRDRFLSAAMVFGVAFLLLVSLLLSAAVTSLATLLNRLPESLFWLGETIHFAASFAIITLLFAMM